MELSQSTQITLRISREVLRLFFNLRKINKNSLKRENLRISSRNTQNLLVSLLNFSLKRPLIKKSLTQMMRMIRKKMRRKRKTRRRRRMRMIQKSRMMTKKKRKRRRLKRSRKSLMSMNSLTNLSQSG